MIVSGSRRTDIPAFYSEWFMDKVKQDALFMFRRIILRERAATV